MNIHQDRKLSLHKNEALYWAEKKGKVQCLLCPHVCVLADGEWGFCRTRQNVDDGLRSQTYGYPCAVHVDHVEKKPLYHFLPGTTTLSLSTVGCNLRCLNCQNSQISQSVFNKNEYGRIEPEELVDMALRKNCRSISYTYTDPVVYYEYALDTSVLARKKGLKNIIVSAGYIHKKPLRQLCDFIDGANVDLKCFDDKVYQKLCGVRLKTVLQSLETLKEEGVWLEVTNLLVPGYTDNLSMVKQMCRWLVLNGFSGVPVHFNRFFPNHKLGQLHPTDLQLMHAVYDVAKESGLQYVYLGNVQCSETNTCCTECGCVLIRRTAYRVAVVNLKDGKCGECGSVVSGTW